MALSQRLNLRVTQKTSLTPALKQAIKLLQLQRLELKTEIEQELLTNPCLEEDEEGDEPERTSESGTESTPETTASASGEEAPAEPAGEEAPVEADIDYDYYFGDDVPRGGGGEMAGGEDETPGLEAYATRAESLSEHLDWQLRMNESDPECRRIGAFLVGNLLESGYLATPPFELATALGVELEEFEIVRRRLQEYDPPGCFATDLVDSLAAQLRAGGEDETLAARLLAEAPDGLEAGIDDAALAARLSTAELKIMPVEVAAARRRLRSLDPEPGQRFVARGGDPIEPDLVLTIDAEGFKIAPIEDGLPRLRISPFYLASLKKPELESGQNSYVRERLRAAVGFIKSLEERRRTMLKIAQAVIGRQIGYFSEGETALRPLILRDIAAEAEVHESTVSRVVTGKYILTPKGLMSLKFFFVKPASGDGSEALSARHLQAQIREIIGRESAARPYSDEQIVTRLRDDYNVTLARRTVAKYREEMGLASARARRTRQDTIPAKGEPDES